MQILIDCQMIPKKSMIDIPLCRMVSLQVVRHVLQININKMKADFIHNYRLGSAVFYVSTTNFLGQERMVSDEDKASWFKNWQQKNCKFERLVAKDKDL